MNPTLHATRAGLHRGWIEFRQALTSPQELVYTVMVNGLLLLVVFLQRDTTVDGAWHSLGTATMSSLLGMTVALGGLMGVATVLASDREDGTLLRAKATPRGLVGYLAARIVLVSLNTLLSIAVLLVAGLLLVPHLTPADLAGWLTLLWVTGLGLLATLPWGAMVGALVKSAHSGFGLTFLPLSGLVTISGIFYPIAALPGWLQGVAQVFPIYWLGLGARSALLPDAAAATEISGSWRSLATATVLAAWAAAGLLLAPRVLSRMAERESGALMQIRRRQVLHRGY